MALLKHWTGFAVDDNRSTISCPQCGAPVINTQAGLDQHRARVHAEKLTLTRLKTTRMPRKYERRGSRPHMSEELRMLCEACRDDDHLICDGGRCRCVCTLELDEPHRWRKV
jgi:hypothetical protein